MGGRAKHALPFLPLFYLPRAENGFLEAGLVFLCFFRVVFDGSVKVFYRQRNVLFCTSSEAIGNTEGVEYHGVKWFPHVVEHFIPFKFGKELKCRVVILKSPKTVLIADGKFGGRLLAILGFHVLVRFVEPRYGLGVILCNIASSLDVKVANLKLCARVPGLGGNHVILESFVQVLFYAVACRVAHCYVVGRLDITTFHFI